MKLDLHNDFTTGNNPYPKSCPQTLHLLKKYKKIAAPKIPASKVSSFAQGYANKGNGGRGGVKKKAEMIKVMTSSNGRISNSTSVVKKDIQRPISQRLNKIKTIITRAQGPPVVDQS